MLQQQPTPQASAAFNFAATGGTLMENHVDCGIRMKMADAAGRPWFSCNARGFVETAQFDAMHRVTANQVSLRGSGTTMTFSRTGFGESLALADAQARNLRGRLLERFNQAGWATMDGLSSQGEVFATTTALSCNYESGPQGMPALDIPALTGSKPVDAGLQNQDYTTAQQRIDALGRILEAVNPNGNVAQTEYQLSGVPGRAAVDGVIYLQDLTYNAKDQLLSCVTGVAADGAGGLFTSVYRYDPRTFIRQRAYASTDAAFIAALPANSDAPIDGSSDTGRRQDASYALDPEGNVLLIDDAYPAIVFGASSTSVARTVYGYDAFYRLLTADGIESPAASPIGGAPGIGFAAGAVSLNAAGEAQLTAYRQSYWYDDGGNITAMNHYSNGIADSGRSVAMKVSSASNRAIAGSYYASLGGTAGGTEIDESFFTGNAVFDANGNQLKNANLSAMAWGFQDQMAQSSYPDPDLSGGTVTEYYVYAAGVTRTRKITMTSDAAGVVTRLDTVLYLGDVEMRATFLQADPADGIGYDGENVSNGTQTVGYSELRIKLGHTQSARVLTGTLAEGAAPTARTYYSLTNHIDSCQAELDELGNITNYQGFYPYGGTAFSAANDQSGGGSLALKQLQYSGQQKDGSGLYFYGFRYYDAASFRWTRPDPAGIAGSSLNLYVMVGGNPVTYRDAHGLIACHFLVAGLPVFAFCSVWGLFFWLAAASIPGDSYTDATIRGAIVAAGRQVARASEALVKRGLSVRRRKFMTAPGYGLRMSILAFPGAQDHVRAGMGWTMQTFRRLRAEGLGEAFEVTIMSVIGSSSIGKEPWSLFVMLVTMGAGYGVWEVSNIALQGLQNEYTVYNSSVELSDGDGEILFPPQLGRFSKTEKFMREIAFSRWLDTATQAAVRIGLAPQMTYPSFNALAQSGLWVLRNEAGRLGEEIITGAVKRCRGKSLLTSKKGKLLYNINTGEFTQIRYGDTSNEVSFRKLSNESLETYFLKHIPTDDRTRVRNAMQTRPAAWSDAASVYTDPELPVSIGHGLQSAARVNSTSVLPSLGQGDENVHDQQHLLGSPHQPA